MSRNIITDAAPAAVGVTSEIDRRRDYDLSGGRALVGLLDNPWPPSLRDSMHFHNCMEIGICLSGSGQITIGRRQWAFSADTVVIVPAGVLHAQQNESLPVTHWLYVLVNEDVFLSETPERIRSEMEQRLQHLSAGVCLTSGRASGLIRTTVTEMFRLYHHHRTLDDLELDSLLRLLMTRLSAPQAHMPEQPDTLIEQDISAVEPAMRYVSVNYARKILIEQMAACCSMSESYFRKVFSAVTGMPPLEYVNRYRVFRSIDLLYHSRHSILDIAEMTGFPSIATYNRNFRRYTGTSPAKWRRNTHA